jgi:hypothetical protein
MSLLASAHQLAGSSTAERIYECKEQDKSDQLTCWASGACIDQSSLTCPFLTQGVLGFAKYHLLKRSL